MKKVLTKDIKKMGEAKFARWQDLFANFYFKVEHIKGKENYLPDFISGEFIYPAKHVMIIVTEWDQGQQKEVLITIPDNISWSEYKESWKPTWKLRNTKVLDANLQAHTDIVHLVPERRVYRKGSKWIHNMVYSNNINAASQAQDALLHDFHELIMIWSHGGSRSGVYERYFQ